MPTFDRSVSSGSLSAHSDCTDSDWDRSTSDLPSLVRPTTPQRQSSISSSSTSSSFQEQSSSIVFPGSHPMDPANEHTPRRRAVTQVPPAAATDDTSPESEFTQVEPRKGGKRTLSDLLCRRVGSASEAHRIADVLGQWINASSSPYEPDTDDFFTPSCTSAPRTPLSPSPVSRSTPHTPSGSSSSASAFGFRTTTMGDAPGRRGSITNRGGVTVTVNVRPAESADAASGAGGAQPQTRSAAVGGV